MIEEEFKEIDIDYLINLWNEKSITNNKHKQEINPQIQKPLVVIECPYLSEDTPNLNILIKYAKMCLNDSLTKREAPILTSLLYKQITNFNKQTDHDITLQNDISWIKVADLVAVYIDYGISQSMRIAINTAKLYNIKIEYRTIGMIEN